MAQRSLLLLLLALSCGNSLGTLHGESAFRQFVTFYFSFKDSQNPLNNKSTNVSAEETQNDFYFHQGSNKGSGGKKLSSEGSAHLNSPCDWSNKNNNSLTQQCDMPRTNLFCDPTSKLCECFSWERLKSNGVIHNSGSDDEEELEGIQGYLLSLGDFLAIDMTWNEELGQCQSLNGSACLVRSSLPEQQLQPPNNYVSCHSSLVCREVHEEGFAIGRCLLPTEEGD